MTSPDGHHRHEQGDLPQWPFPPLDPAEEKSEPADTERAGHGASDSDPSSGELGAERPVGATTHALLQRLADEEPELEAVLRKALRENLVSEDVIRALDIATRSINDDLVQALTVASRTINRDVADRLTAASQAIEENVAPSAELLAQTADRVERASERLSRFSGALDTQSGRQPQGARRPSSPQRGQRSRSDDMLAGSYVDKTYTTLLRVFLLGMGTGLLLIFIIQAIAIYWWTS